MSKKRLVRMRFKEVKDFPGYYVGTDGSVWSTLRIEVHGKGKGRIRTYLYGPWRRIDGWVNTQGYVCFSPTRRDGRRYSIRVNRIVAEAFHGKPPPGKVYCAHGNGVKTDNRASNLRWATRKENEADKISHGLTNRGSRNGQSKLNESQVLEIRRLYELGRSQEKIGSMFGVSRTAVKLIVNRRNWKHIA